MPNHPHDTFMDVAIAEARLAADRGEVPIGAVIVRNGIILAQAGNNVIENHDPTGHAEIIVIRQSAKIIGSERLTDCDLYVTLEPCGMCAAAISFARIRRLYYGASDEKGGAIEHGAQFFSLKTCHHSPDIYSGFQENESASLLRGFFRSRR